MGAHQALEHAEHTAHSGGHAHEHGHGGDDEHAKGKVNGKILGLTMVLIAFCAAMVGSERNELTKAMILESQANALYTGASTKFRIVMIEIEKLNNSASASAPLTTPEGGYRKRLVRLYQDYSKERSFGKEWVDSYEPLVEAHFGAAEGYERAQLIAEIGVVLASLAVLLASRAAWILSLVLAMGSVGQLGQTYAQTRHEAGAASAHVHVKEEAYASLRKNHTGANEDELAVEALDPGGKIRAEMEKSSTGEAVKEGAEKKEMR